MQCKGTTKSGAQCNRNARKHSDYCFIHSLPSKNDELRKKYENLSPVARRFSETLQHEIEKLLESKKITIGVPIERRVKEWSSIEEKIERKKIDFEDLKQIGDLVGIRLCLLFVRDLGLVHDLLTSSFDVISHEDTSGRLEETEFGYQSVHYEVKFPGHWLSVPTMAEFEGFRAEIQVRTLAQHIWAAASHKLQYKNESSVPPPLRRSIFRVSAILETVDLEFERLLNERDEYVGAIGARSGRAIPLNVDVVREVLDSEWPAANRERDEDYEQLMFELLQNGVSTNHELKKLIDDTKVQVLNDEKASVHRSKRRVEGGETPGGTTIQRTNRGVYYTHVGLTRIALGEAFPQDDKDE